MTQDEKKVAVITATSYIEDIFNIENFTRYGAEYKKEVRKILLEMRVHDPERFSASQYVLKRLIDEFRGDSRLHYSSYYVNSKRKIKKEVMLRNEKMFLAYYGITEDGEIIARPKSQKELADEYDVSPNTIRVILITMSDRMHYNWFYDSVKQVCMKLETETY